ncbi:MAG: hypothetical protein JXQ30_16895 [Spirochaetes bacterium]|nr:hypothetical protein [Spirochaetota bacterium]
MIIRVNEQELDYKMEKEKTLGEVLESIEKWVGEEGGVIQKVTVDSMDLPLSQESEIVKRGVSEITTVDVLVDSRQRHAAQTLSTLGEYIMTTLGADFGKDLHSSYGELMNALGMIIEASTHATRVLGLRAKLILAKREMTLDTVLGKLVELEKKYKSRYIDEEGISELQAALTCLVSLLPKMLKWAVVKNPSAFHFSKKSKSRDYFAEIVADLYTVLRKTEDLFEKIAENLQIGNDAEALADIYCVTEILDECIVLLRASSEYGIDYEQLEWDGNGTETVFSEVSNTLREAMEALDIRDMVSVGDVMEFEIRPQWRKIAGLVGSMCDLIGE